MIAFEILLAIIAASIYAYAEEIKNYRMKFMVIFFIVLNAILTIGSTIIYAQ